MLWIESCLPPKDYIDVLTSVPMNVAFNQVIMRSFWQVLIQYDSVLTRGGQFGHRHAQRRALHDGGSRDWSGAGVSRGMPPTDSHPRTSEEARKDSTQNLRGNRALPTPWLQTSSFQNCERVNFCCLKPPLVGFVTSALPRKSIKLKNNV